MAQASTVVRSYSDAVSAHVARVKLAGAGITALVMDENQVTVNPLISIALGGVKVVVRENDVEAAREILECKVDVEAESCPRCGGTELTRHFAGRRSAFLTLLFLGIPIGRSRTKVRCEDCEHTWRE